MTGLHKRIQTSAIWVILRRVVGSCLGFFTALWIVRMLSVDEYGIYSLLVALCAYTGLLSCSGVIHVFQRYIPELALEKRLHTMRSLVMRGVLLQVILSIFAVLVLGVLSRRIGTLLQVHNLRWYFGLYAPVIVLSLTGGLMAIVLGSLFLHKYVALAQFAYAGMRALGVLMFVGFGFGLTGLILSDCIAWSMLLVLLVYPYRSRFTGVNAAREKERFPTRRFLQYGGYSFFNDVGNSVLAVTTDNFVLAAFLGPVAVGLYAFADKVVQLFAEFLPGRMFHDLIAPTFFTRYADTKDPEELQKMFQLLMKLDALVFFPFVVGVWVLGDKMILYVFGEKYLGALLPLWVFVTFRSVYGCVSPIGFVVKAIEKVEILFKAKVFAVYNLIGDLLVVRKYGVVGVALVTCSACLLQLLFIYTCTRKHIDIKVDWRGLAAILSNSLLMGAVLYFCRGIVTGIYSFALVTIAGVLLYAVFAFANKAFRPIERELLNRVLPKPVFVF